MQHIILATGPGAAFLFYSNLQSGLIRVDPVYWDAATQKHRTQTLQSREGLPPENSKPPQAVRHPPSLFRNSNIFSIGEKPPAQNK
jgi:hypothetical protein